MGTFKCKKSTKTGFFLSLCRVHQPRHTAMRPFLSLLNVSLACCGATHGKAAKLCRVPHVPHAGHMAKFEILSWRTSKSPFPPSPLSPRRLNVCLVPSDRHMAKLPSATAVSVPAPFDDLFCGILEITHGKHICCVPDKWYTAKWSSPSRWLPCWLCRVRPTANGLPCVIRPSPCASITWQSSRLRSESFPRIQINSKRTVSQKERVVE